MQFFQKVMPAVLIAALLLAIPGSAAHAADATPQPATLQCAEGLCTVQMPAEKLPLLAKLGAALGWSALQGQTDALPAGADLRIDDELTLTLPVGEIVLPKAQLDVDLDEDNRIERLHGVVETPFPTLGVLSDVRMVQPAQAEVGLELGKNLSHLAAPLDPLRQYLFFNINSGMDVAGQVTGTGETLSLSAPAGQALTLVIDTQEPLVYLAGNVTVNTSGEMLLAGPLLELAQQSELIPDSLPLRQRTQVVVTGLAGKEVDDYLHLGGSWAVDAGALGRSLGIEATPLAIQGLVTISAQGLKMDGVVSSSIEPETVLDSSARLTAFIPFKKSAPAAYVETEAAIEVPLAKIDAEGSARLELPKIDTSAVETTLQGWLTALGQQAETGGQSVQNLTQRSGAWLAALPKPW
jgi:hypothetical protein